MLKFYRNPVAITGALLVATAATNASAAITFDVTDAVAGLVAMGAGLALIGAAKLGPAAIAVGWKWFKAMIFG